MKHKSAEPLSVKLARTLLRNFGEKAVQLVDERIEQVIGDGQTTARWRDARVYLVAFSTANHHLVKALSILDEVKELKASIHVNQAIEVLGVRVGERPYDTQDDTGSSLDRGELATKTKL